MNIIRQFWKGITLVLFVTSMISPTHADTASPTLQVVLAPSSVGGDKPIDCLVSASPVPKSPLAVDLTTSNPALTVQAGIGYAVTAGTASITLTALAPSCHVLLKVAAGCAFRVATVSAVSSSVTPPSYAPGSATLTITPAAMLSVIVPYGLPVLVTSPSSAISSESSRHGDQIIFTVAQDVYIDLKPDGTVDPTDSNPLTRVIVIPRGYPVPCTVTQSNHSFGPFRRGKIALQIDGVETVDGSLVPVLALVAAKGLHSTDGLQPNIANVDKSGQTLQASATAASQVGANPVVYGRTDSSAVLTGIAELVVGFGVSKAISSSDTVSGLVVGALISGSNVTTLFSGVPAAIPAGVTFTVITAKPVSVVVKNPFAGL